MSFHTDPAALRQQHCAQQRLSPHEPFAAHQINPYITFPSESNCATARSPHRYTKTNNTGKVLDRMKAHRERLNVINSAAKPTPPVAYTNRYGLHSNTRRSAEQTKTKVQFLKDTILHVQKVQLTNNNDTGGGNYVSQGSRATTTFVDTPSLRNHDDDCSDEYENDVNVKGDTIMYKPERNRNDSHHSNSPERAEQSLRNGLNAEPTAPNQLLKAEEKNNPLRQYNEVLLRQERLKLEMRQLEAEKRKAILMKVGFDFEEEANVELHKYKQDLDEKTQKAVAEIQSCEKITLNQLDKALQGIEEQRKNLLIAEGKIIEERQKLIDKTKLAVEQAAKINEQIYQQKRERLNARVQEQLKVINREIGGVNE